MAATEDRRETDSGIEIKPVYTAQDAPGELEPPGEFPFTRGPYEDMYPSEWKSAGGKNSRGRFFRSTYVLL